MGRWLQILFFLFSINAFLGAAHAADSDGDLTSAASVTEPVGLDTTINTAGGALDLFDFTLVDGSSSDVLPLTVSQVVVHVSGTSTDAERGQIVWRLDGADVSNVTGSYDSGADTITFSGLTISVADGQGEVYTINAYYNPNTNLTDKRAFILSVDGDTDLTVGDSATSTQMGATSPVTNGSGTTVDVVATQLAFATQPAGSVSGAALTMQPIVSAQDAAGNVDVDFTETVTLTEASAGTLSGDMDVAAVSGVATFTDVTYTATADQESFTLTANDQDGAGTDLGTVDANSVTSDVVATKLVFSTEPAPTTVDSGVSTAFSTVPVVQAVDADDVLDAGYSTGITLSANGVGSALLDGVAGDSDGNNDTVSLAPAGGFVTFTGLTITYTNNGSGDEDFTLRAESNLLAVDSTTITSKDVTPPSVSSVTPPADEIYIANENLDFTVQFSELVVVTGAPRIAITLESGTRFADYISGSGSNAVTFRYTPQNGDHDHDYNGISLASDIDLNGGTIKDGADNDASLTLGSVNTSGVEVARAKLNASVTNNDSDGVVMGDSVTYTVVVENASGEDIVDGVIGTGALQVVITPSGLTDITVSGCVTAGTGTTCDNDLPTALVPIYTDYVDLPVGGSVTYTLSGMVALATATNVEVKVVHPNADPTSGTGLQNPGSGGGGVYGFVAEDTDVIDSPMNFTLYDDTNFLACGATSISWDNGTVEINDPSCYSNIVQNSTPNQLAFNAGSAGVYYCGFSQLVMTATETRIYASGSCISSGGTAHGGSYPDSDNDGYDDIEELNAGTNPADPNDYPGVTTHCTTGTDLTIGPVTYAIDDVESCTATNSISTSGAVTLTGNGSAGANINYSAPIINLVDGFSVQAGAVFRAGQEVVSMRSLSTDVAPIVADVTATETSAKVTSLASSAEIFGATRLMQDQLPEELRSILEAYGAVAEDIFADSTGSYIVFATETALVNIDTNGMFDVYLYDIVDQELKPLSVSMDGYTANGQSRQPRIDGGGNYVVYSSLASDIIPEDTNGVSDIYINALAIGLNERVSMDTNGTQRVAPAQNPSIATSYPIVTYDSDDNLGLKQVFAHEYHDHETGPTQVSSAGDLNGVKTQSHHASLSPNGQYIAYFAEVVVDAAVTSCNVIIYNGISESIVGCPIGALDGSDYSSLSVDDEGEVNYSD
jgi:hypothetical protein